MTTQAPTSTPDTPQRRLLGQLRGAFTRAVEKYKNGPRGLVRFFAAASVPAVVSAGMMAAGAGPAAIMLGNLGVGAAAMAGALAAGAGAAVVVVVGVGTVAAGAIAVGAGALAAAGAAAGAVAGAGAGAVVVGACTIGAATIGASTACDVARQKGLSVRRSVSGYLAGCALSAMTAFAAASNAPKPPVAPAQAAPPATLTIEAKGACIGRQLSDPVELKNGNRQYVLTVPQGCEVK